MKLDLAGAIAKENSLLEEIQNLLDELAEELEQVENQAAIKM